MHALIAKITRNYILKSYVCSKVDINLTTPTSKDVYIYMLAHMAAARKVE